MRFDTAATTNPIDQLKFVGKPIDRIDGPLKTTGTAPYAYERHDVAPNAAHGYVIGSAIAKGRIASIDDSVRSKGQIWTNRVAPHSVSRLPACRRSSAMASA